MSISFVVRFEQNKTTNIRAKTFIQDLLERVKLIRSELLYTLGILNFLYTCGDYLFEIHWPDRLEKFNTMFKIWEFNVAKEVCFINFDVLKGILEYSRGLVIAYSLVW